MSPELRIFCLPVLTMYWPAHQLFYSDVLFQDKICSINKVWYGHVPRLNQFAHVIFKVWTVFVFHHFMVHSYIMQSAIFLVQEQPRCSETFNTSFLLPLLCLVMVCLKEWFSVKHPIQIFRRVWVSQGYLETSLKLFFIVKQKGRSLQNSTSNITFRNINS